MEHIKILVIEDDIKPDYKDIERSLISCFPDAEIKHCCYFDEIDMESLKKDKYTLCISGLLEHQGVINFDSYEFDEAFSKGINAISRLFQCLGCHYIVATKTPVNVLRTQFDKMKEDPAMSVLFGKCLSSLHDDLIDARGATFTIYNRGNVHIIAKPYNQYGNKIAAFDWWLEEFKKMVSFLYIK